MNTNALLPETVGTMNPTCNVSDAGTSLPRTFFPSRAQWQLVTNLEDTHGHATAFPTRSKHPSLPQENTQNKRTALSTSQLTHGWSCPTNEIANVARKISDVDYLLPIPILTRKAQVKAMDPQGKRQAYIEFQRKFKAAIDIEFKSSGIHRLFCAGRMWDNHLQVYGNVCSETCPCVLDMQCLSADVVALKMRKPGKWTNPLHLDGKTLPTGFMSNFNNKFGPLLHAKYPNDSSLRLLERLLAMWSQHRKQRRFGRLKCDDDCGCIEAWKYVFAEGALNSEETCKDGQGGSSLTVLLQTKSSEKQTEILRDTAVMSYREHVPMPWNASESDLGELRQQARSASDTGRAVQSIRSILKGGLHYAKLFERDVMRVKFSLDQGARRFSLDDAAKVCLEHDDSAATAVPAERLFAAFQCHSIEDIFAILEAGAASEVSGEDQNWIRKTLIKPLLARTKAQFQKANDVNLLTEIRDLVLKDKILKILVNAEHAVKLTRALKHWMSFEVNVEEIMGLGVVGEELNDPTEMSLDISSTWKLTGFDESRQIDMTMDLAEARAFSSGNSRLTRLHHNSFLERDGKVELRITSRLRDGKHLVLGTTAIARSTLMEELHAWGPVLSLELTPKTASLKPGATVRIRARKVKLHSAFVTNHRNKLLGKVKEVADWIERINKDLSQTGANFKLSSNIPVSGESLLHAAVHLEDPVLVEALILKGTQPVTSYKTSALLLAIDMAEGRKAFRRVELDKIVAMLQHHDSRSPAVESSLLNIGATASSEPEKIDGALADEPPAASVTGSLVASSLALVSGDAPPVSIIRPSPPSARPPQASNELSDIAASDCVRGTENADQMACSSSLPLLDADWVLPSYCLCRRCFFHERRSICSRRDSCTYIHVHRPFGESFEERLAEFGGAEYLPNDFQDMVTLNTCILEDAVSGKSWFTAKFSTVKTTQRVWQDVIFPESEGGQVSTQGIFWYESEAAARRALEKAVFITFEAIDKNRQLGSGLQGAYKLLPMKRSREELKRELIENNK